MTGFDMFLLAMLLVGFVLVVAFAIKCPPLRGHREVCRQDGCDGRMEKLNHLALDQYLESKGDALPDETKHLLTVPEVYMCSECGVTEERRG